VVAADGTTITVPAFLRAEFPRTQYVGADPAIEGLLSGGPGRDGIPALDEPRFVPIAEFDRPDDVQAIVLADGPEVRAYPYNILIWHEIVNDTVDGQPVAVTFCPLCGSAIVFDRTLPSGEVATFGVSGALIESNLVMFDRATESLWQQSTGEALAGALVGQELDRVQFQRLTLGELRERYPEAQVLSEQTGHARTYGRNPYSGYNESDEFIFAPSFTDARLDPKEIVVVFEVEGTPAAVPWRSLSSGETYTPSVAGEDVVLTKDGSELTITRSSGETIPFYFEMWFSFAVQNEEEGVLLEL
jgi:hypothetical protein